MFDDDYTNCFDDMSSAIDDTFDYSTDCHMDEQPSSCSCHDFDINPANGLPMTGCVDIEGNPYGTDSSSFDDF